MMGILAPFGAIALLFVLLLLHGTRIGHCEDGINEILNRLDDLDDDVRKLTNT